jgi:hypothetical protein
MKQGILSHVVVNATESTYNYKCNNLFCTIIISSSTDSTKKKWKTQVRCVSAGKQNTLNRNLWKMSASVVRMDPDHASRQPTELAWQIPIAHIQCWHTPDDGQWTCPKHAEYFIKYILEIVHLVGFHYKENK